MDKTKKRVDIRLKPNKIVRGMAEIREDGVSITYKKITYNTPKELSEAIDYDTLVMGDPVFVDALKKAGYPARDIIKKRDSLHVTIPTHLIDMVQQEALDNNSTVSAVLEGILRKHYE